MIFRCSNKMIADAKMMISKGASSYALKEKHKISQLLADQIYAVAIKFDEESCYDTSLIEWRAVVCLFCDGITTEDRLCEWFVSFMLDGKPKVPGVGPKALSQIEGVLKASGRIPSDFSVKKKCRDPDDKMVSVVVDGRPRQRKACSTLLVASDDGALPVTIRMPKINPGESVLVHLDGRPLEIVTKPAE